MNQFDVLIADLEIAEKRREMILFVNIAAAIFIGLIPLELPVSKSQLSVIAVELPPPYVNFAGGLSVIYMEKLRINW